MKPAPGSREKWQHYNRRGQKARQKATVSLPNLAPSKRPPR
jgi:hypothetical protein